MPNLYIGIDPSFTDTAIVGISEDKILFEKHIKSKPIDNIHKRLCDFYRDGKEIIESIMTDTQYQIDHDNIIFGIEEPMGLHSGNGAKMGQIFACLILALKEIDPDKVHIYKPSQIKKFATGKGNAKKDLMLLSCYKKWGVSFTSHDTADAYAIARLVESEATATKD